MKKVGKKNLKKILNSEQTGGRKISFENSASTFALKLSKSGGGIQNIEKRDEAFISNVPISEETPMLVDGRCCLLIHTQK